MSFPLLPLSTFKPMIDFRENCYVEYSIRGHRQLCNIDWIPSIINNNMTKTQTNLVEAKSAPPNVASWNDVWE